MMLISNSDQHKTHIESFLNKFPYIEGFVKSALLSPFKYISNVVQLCLQTYSLYDSKAMLDAKNFAEDLEIIEITANSASDSLLSSSETYEAPSKERLLHVIDRVKIIAHKFGIKNPIKIFSSEKYTRETAESYGTSFFKSRNTYLLLSFDAINASDEALDFIIAHELSHIKNNDSLKKLGLILYKVAIETFTLVIFPFALPLAAGINFLLEKKLSQRFEKIADLDAMKTLNTNQGALELFEPLADSLKSEYQREKAAFYNSKDKSVYYNKGPFLERTLKKILSFLSTSFYFPSISKDGNLRGSIDHPALSDRLKYTKAFDEGSNDQIIQEHIEVFSEEPEELFEDALDSDINVDREGDVFFDAHEYPPLEGFYTDIDRIILTKNGTHTPHDLTKLIGKILPPEKYLSTYHFNPDTNEFVFTLKKPVTGTITSFDNEEEALSFLQGASFTFSKTVTGKVIPETDTTPPKVSIEGIQFNYPISYWLPTLSFTPNSIVLTPLYGMSSKYNTNMDLIETEVDTGTSILGTVHRVREVKRYMHTFSNITWSEN